jgi:hypothetical protein
MTPSISRWMFTRKSSNGPFSTDSPRTNRVTSLDRRSLRRAHRHLEIADVARRTREALVRTSARPMLCRNIACRIHRIGPGSADRDVAGVFLRPPHPEGFDDSQRGFVANETSDSCKGPPNNSCCLPTHELLASLALTGWEVRRRHTQVLGCLRLQGLGSLNLTQISV